MILGYLGAGTLLAALVMGGFSALLSLWAGRRESAIFIQIGRRAFYAAAAMTLLGAVVLEVALLTRGNQRVSVAILTDDDDSHEVGKETLRGIAARLLHGLGSPDSNPR